MRVSRLRFQPYARDGQAGQKAWGEGWGAPISAGLQGFGRREMKISREELANCIIYQVSAP